jgi:hypothetical protein
MWPGGAVEESNLGDKLPLVAAATIRFGLHEFLRRFTA